MSIPRGLQSPVKPPATKSLVVVHSFSAFPDVHVFSSVENARKFVERDIRRVHDSEIEDDERVEAQITVDDQGVKGNVPEFPLRGGVAFLEAQYDDVPNDFVQWYIVPEDEIIDLEKDEVPWDE